MAKYFIPKELLTYISRKLLLTLSLDANISFQMIYNHKLPEEGDGPVSEYLSEFDSAAGSIVRRDGEITGKGVTGILPMK